MKTFALAELAATTQAFVERNSRLGYRLETVARDQFGVLFQGANRFSQFFCQITVEVAVLNQWAQLQERLFKPEALQPNRYLVYVYPDAVAKTANLFEELSRAERDDRFFRKVFIGIPDGATGPMIERALADRIPLWFEERQSVLRQYVPVMSEFVPDAALLQVFLEDTPGGVVRRIERDSRFAYLRRPAQTPVLASGLADATRVGPTTRRGARLTHLALEDFRRFGRRSFDLDGDVVLICGRNGTGKTTLCDAIELSLFSELRRLRGDPDLSKSDVALVPFIRAGAVTDSARIELVGRKSGQPFVIRTTITEDGISKQLDGVEITKEGVLQCVTQSEDLLKRGLQDILLHTHFLGQHSIRDFIYGNRLDGTEKITSTRYTLLAEMFGFGEVERLKTRLSAVLAQLKRSKVTAADEAIDGIRRQIRGLQQKYGPKCRADLQGKGYQIAAEPAIARLHALVPQLGEAFGSEVVSQALNVTPPLENYLSTCESLVSSLTAQLRRIENEAVNLKRIGRLVARLATLNPELSFPRLGTAESMITEARVKVDQTIRDTEALRSHLESIDAQIADKQSQYARIETFLSRLPHYLELLGAEQEAVLNLEQLQRRRTAALQRQGLLLGQLQTRTAEDQALARQVAATERKLALVQETVKFLPAAAEARAAIAQQQTELAAVATAMGEAQRRLAQLGGSVLPEEGGTTSPTVDWSGLFPNDNPRCPCCGTGFDSRSDFEDRVREELQGNHGPELRAFLAGLMRRSAAATKAHVTESLRVYSREQDALENGIRAHTQTVAHFDGLVRQLALVDASVASLETLMQGLQTTLETQRHALRASNAEILREEITKVQAEITILNDSAQQQHLRRLREEIAEIARPTEELMPKNVRLDRDLIAQRMTELRENIDGLIARRAQARLELSRLPTAEGIREMDQCLQELETLLLSLDKRGGNPLARASEAAEENLARQKRYHEWFTELEDLTKLFGLLSAQERGDQMRGESERLEAERAEWLECYRAINEINSRLSKLSFSGLEQSLAEYGPLINQIYQKFIRHDIFSALVLIPKASEKARKRDLYLKLKSYAGKTEYTPASYLSEAQLNILALSIFLTRVMYQNISDLESVFIDDPIQQMDDMNAAAFVDVILGLSQIGKQIVITTCNQDFYQLVMHKLHSVATTGQITFKTIDLNARPDA